MKSYQLGVIGAGWIAKAHMSNLQLAGRADIRWIAARNQENLEKVRADFSIPNKTQNYHDILRDPAVEVVLITTPPHLHQEMFIECVQAGKHVLLEKPMALDMYEIEKMLQVKGLHPEVIAMECSARHSRLNPKFRAVKEIIDSGALGEIYSIYHSSVARQNRPGIEFHPVAKWFLDKSQAGGGPLFDWGVYDLSFHLGVLGDQFELERIESKILMKGLDEVDPGTEIYDVEEHFAMNMRFSGGLNYYWERGAHANVEVPNETRIYGTRGGIKLAYCTWDDPVIILYDIDQEGKAREQKVEVDMSQHPDDGFALMEHFLNVLDGLDQPIISLELAKKHMDIIIRCSQFTDNSI